jgi:hypothetical protein
MSERRFPTSVSVALLLLMSQISPSAYAVDRRLQEYDVFGPYTFSNLVDQAWRTNDDAFRAFIWSHWHEHRKGIAQITTYSKEGKASACNFTYYIEPDESDSWHIEELSKCKKGPRKPDRQIITSVYRVANDGSGRRVPDSADVPESSYHLVFK